MKTLKIIKHHLVKYQMHYYMLMSGALLCLLSMHSFAAAPPAAGTDILATSGIDKTVETSFGYGSTIMKVAMAAELFLGVVAYIKSKNPMVLVGIPVIMIATAGLSTLIS